MFLWWIARSNWAENTQRSIALLRLVRWEQSKQLFEESIYFKSWHHPGMSDNKFVDKYSSCHWDEGWRRGEVLNNKSAILLIKHFWPSNVKIKMFRRPHHVWNFSPSPCNQQTIQISRTRQCHVTKIFLKRFYCLHAHWMSVNINLLGSHETFYDGLRICWMVILIPGLMKPSSQATLSNQNTFYLMDRLNKNFCCRYE